MKILSFRKKKPKDSMIYKQSRKFSDSKAYFSLRLIDLMLVTILLLFFLLLLLILKQIKNSLKHQKLDVR